MLLIEEPEAYLSALAQEHLSHVLLKYLIRRCLAAVVSTHSEAFIRVTHRDSLIVLTREGVDGVRAHRRPHPTTLRALGIEHRLRAIVYVEDEAAREFAGAIVREIDPELYYGIEFQPMGGFADVTSALRLHKRLRSRLKFIGALDGDLRGSVPDDIYDVSVLLPGAEPVEVALRAIVLQNRDASCARLGHPEAGQILASLDGLDHHDWLTSLARALETGISDVIKRLFPLWLEVDGNREASERLCADLRGFNI